MRSLRTTESWSQTHTIPLTTNHAWRFKAHCAAMDADLFFPSGTSNAATSQALRAKRVCADCPVTKECLDWAQRTNQTYGVWGGFDAQELSAMRAAGASQSAA